VNTEEMIELLQGLQEDAGGPVPVQVLVQTNKGQNVMVSPDYYDVELKDRESGKSVLIDLS
jgi:hypothetical protein